MSQTAQQATAEAASTILDSTSPEETRPTRRDQCRDGPRPCPWVSCRFSLYLDVNPETGHLKLNFPDLEPDQMRESCALDVAERGGATLEEVGAMLGVTRERIRQLEKKGLTSLRRVGIKLG